MNKKYLVWFIVIALVVIAGILVYVFRCKLFPSLSSCMEKPTDAVPPGSPSTQWVPEKPPYDIGMYGPKIKALQAALGILADGKFGNQTKTAITDAGYSVPLSEEDYNKILANSSQFVGKNAYAKLDGVKVFNLNNTVYKTAAKDEYVGTISGKQGSFYILSEIRKVGTGSVYLK